MTREDADFSFCQGDGEEATEAHREVRRGVAEDVNAGSREKSLSHKKHPCPDCTFCQWCGDDRCALCLRKGSCRRKKLSVAEQIDLYDAINRREPEDDRKR
ncbi:MAG TPA: hypothetical protein VFF53_12135 [Geobacteraceae bacterium]|nr:hypothetical protein [Geobacteraceae bacterium]